MGFPLAIYATNIPNSFLFYPTWTNQTIGNEDGRKRKGKRSYRGDVWKEYLGERINIYIDIKTGEWDFFSGIGRKLSRWKLCLIDSSLRNVEASFLDNLAGAILAVFHQSQGFSPFWTGEAGQHSSQRRKTRWCIFVEEQEDLRRSSWRSCAAMRGCRQDCTVGTWSFSLSWNVIKANSNLSLILGAAFNEGTSRSLHPSSHH